MSVFPRWIPAGRRAAARGSLPVALACLLVLGAGSAFGSSPAGPGSNLSGNNACAVTAGTMSFSPALRTHGDGNRAYVSLTLTLSHCSRSAAASGTFTGSPSFFLANDSCTSLFAAPPSADPVSGNVLWAPRSANRATDVSFEGRSGSLGPPIHFTLSKGSAYGGSFDGSAKSRFSMRQTDSQFTAACNSAGGLTHLTVRSGSFDVGPSY